MNISSNHLEIEKRTVRKTFRRIIPFVFILYIIGFLDRTNLGYAALEMNSDLGLTAEAFGLAAGIFFIGYALLEVPSNMILYRLGARVWICRIMITWGLIVVLTAWVQTDIQLYVLRFLLGVAEAGFFPGVILYLTFWFRAKERARAVALFMSSVAFANIIGAPLSTWIMDNIQWFGLAGWRWMFILEGIPAVIFGIITFYYLTDRPEQAKWLTEEEKTWLTEEIRKENEKKLAVKKYSTLDVLKDKKVWLFSLLYFLFLLASYGLNFWLPTIIKSLSTVFSNTQVGLIAMIPAIVGLIGLIWWARHSDQTGERWIHGACSLIVAAVGLIGSYFAPNAILSITMISIAFLGTYSFFGPFWALLSMFFTESSAAVAIALVNSIGGLGGFFGPVLLGYLNQSYGLLLFSTVYLLSLIPLIILKKNAFRQELDQSNIERANKAT